MFTARIATSIGQTQLEPKKNGFLCNQSRYAFQRQPHTVRHEFADMHRQYKKMLQAGNLPGNFDVFYIFWATGVNSISL